MTALPFEHLLQGQWRIEDVLGESSHAITYEATHDLTRQKAVIKEYFPRAQVTRVGDRVKAASAADAEVFARNRARFATEARALANMRHENLLRVYDIFAENETVYIVVEFLKGESLERKITRENHLDQAKIDKMLPHLVKSLAVIHEIYCLHLDLSPDRIFLRRDNGIPVLLGVGVVSQEDKSGNRGRNVTAGYSPPELHEESDEAAFTPVSDIYGFAAVLYHCVTGAAPAAADLRLKAVAAGQQDVFEPLCTPQRLTQGYRERFLQAIDEALVLASSDRPGDLFQWHRALTLEEGEDADDVSGTSAGVLGRGRLWIEPMAVDGPADMHILLDGEPFDNGSETSVGIHDLQIEIHGFKPVTRRVQIQDAELRLPIEFERRFDIRVNEALLKAVIEGDVDQIMTMLDSGAMVDFIDQDGETSLMKASASDRSDIVFVLLKAGADVNFRDKHGRTALMAACDQGHEFIVSALLEGGAAVDLKDEEGRTALIMASARGSGPSVMALLAAGATVDAEMDGGGTALMAASLSGDFECVEALLQHRANPGARDQQGLTVLMMAAMNGRADIARALLDAGALVDEENDGKTAVDHALAHGHLQAALLLGVDARLHEAARRGDVAMIRKLLDIGVPVDIADREQRTALALASAHGHAQAVRFLLDAGAEASGKDGSGMTALDYAVSASHPEVAALLGARDLLIDASAAGRTDRVAELLAVGVDVNAKDESGRTALMIASQRGRIETLSVLLEASVALNVQREQDGRTALMMAVEQGHTEAVRMLLDAGANPDVADGEGTALFMACENLHVDIIVLLVQAEADINLVRETDGMTALMVVCRQGHTGIIQTLVAAGADPNIRDHDGWVALMHGCMAGQTQVLSSLLEARVDINSQTRDGKTLLMMAIVEKRDEVVMELLQARTGINVNIRDVEGKTALIHACISGRKEMVQALLRHGARASRRIHTDATDQDGQTALMYACLLGHEAIVTLLLQAGASLHKADRDGWTALMVASRAGHVGTARLLIEHAVSSLFRKNQEGDTARDIARRIGHEKMAILMLWGPALVFMQPLLRWRGTALIPRLLLPGRISHMLRERELAETHTAVSVSSVDARLWVDLKPESGWLFLDGKPFTSGSWVRAGEHTLRAEAEGYKPETRRITIEGVSLHIAISLRVPGKYESFHDHPRCPEMVVLTSGEFFMGSEPDIDAIWDPCEMPRRKVVIGYNLAMGKYPVTVAEYECFVRESKHGGGLDTRIYEERKWSFRHDRNWRDPGFEQSPAHPVVCVSWHDANAYAQWLSDKTGYEYRLPSEAEWEYAARAGSTSLYGHGDQMDKEQANFAGHHGGTVEVDTCAPNVFGLCGMHGNVAEWTEDCWNRNYEEAPVDGSAWKQDGCIWRVHRGGSWVYGAWHLRSSARARDVAHARRNNLGFRVARVL